jgi:NADP-dependent 3-hydroxy acid dehydrogenase YdfG
MNQMTSEPDLKQSYFLGKVVLITGASSGIGRALAYWYLNNGAKVALVGRDIIELNKIAKEFPGQSMAIQCDLTVDIQLFDMKQAIADRYGKLHILINCAGKSIVFLKVV